MTIMRGFLVLIVLILPHLVDAASQGTWTVLVENAGISSMHTAVTHQDKVVLLDRTNVGLSRINFSDSYCRDNPQDRKLKHDCSAHSVMLDPLTRTLRPLKLFTDTWCSSGQFVANGSLVQTGGDYDGLNKVRLLDTSEEDCNWVESDVETLTDGRWYASNQVLEDGVRQIVVGGRYTHSYEFVPKRKAGEGAQSLSFLSQTEDERQADNMYPYLHLLPDGNLFVFANRDAILLDYKDNRVVRTYPRIPGEPRNYPAAGSSVMLPLEGDYKVVEILVCGGARYGAYRDRSGSTMPASQTCGRIVATGENPQWSMETMPLRRTMGDMVMLPTGDVLIINGAQNGCQGWGKATKPAFHPVKYATYDAADRFQVLAATDVPRLYHSTANLLSDGRVLVAGSNTHQYYNFSGEYPTELSIEAFSPPYLDSSNDARRPAISQLYTTTIAYGETFQVEYTVQEREGDLEVNLLSSPFTTHSFSQGQRMLRLATTEPRRRSGAFSTSATAPGAAALAPPGYYMLFVVQGGVPSKAVWVRL